MRKSKTAESAADTAQRIVLSEQSIGLVSVMNARELGGYINTDGLRIKRGKLIRSGQLSGIVKADIDILTQKYDLGTIIDLRTQQEATDLPDPRFGGIRYYNYPVTDECETSEPGFSTGGDTELYYSLMCGSAARNAYRRFFERLLIGGDKAVLFHSVYGKDRAGVAAALLLVLLDIPEETVIGDYLLTNKANARTIRSGEDNAPVPAYPGGVQLPENVYAHSLEYALAGVSVEYGSVKDYIKEIARLSEKEINELKHKYLE